MVSLIFLLVASASIAAALPEPTPGPLLEKRLDCAKITGALSVLKKLGGPATAFCSEYLHVLKTTTRTITRTTYTTKFTSTATATITRPVCPKRQKREDEFEFEELEDVEKRQNLLPQLAGFAAAKISEGCSCLSVQPKATTTRTVPGPTVTRKVTTTSVKCAIGQGACVTNNAYCDYSRPFECCSGYCILYVLTGEAFCGPRCDANDSPCPLTPDSTLQFNCCSGYCGSVTGNVEDPDGICMDFS